MVSVVNKQLLHVKKSTLIPFTFKKKRCVSLWISVIKGNKCCKWHVNFPMSKLVSIVKSESTETRCPNWKDKAVLSHKRNSWKHYFRLVFSITSGNTLLPFLKIIIANLRWFFRWLKPFNIRHAFAWKQPKFLLCFINELQQKCRLSSHIGTRVW